MEDIATLKERYNKFRCLEVKVQRVRIPEDLVARTGKFRHELEVVPEKALKGRALAVAAR